MANKREEDLIQANIVEWYNNTYCLEHHENRGLIFSVPNGGTRHKLEAMVLKTTGLLRGVSDLIITLPNGSLIYCEVKTETGRQDSDQIKFEKRVTKLGYKYILVRSFVDFSNQIETLING